MFNGKCPVDSSALKSERSIGTSNLEAIKTEMVSFIPLKQQKENHGSLLLASKVRRKCCSRRLFEPAVREKATSSSSDHEKFRTKIVW